MQLSEILEENSVKEISDRTRVAEENLEYLFASEFAALSKVKTLGFISILEREYKADLSELKAQALEYYGERREGHLFPIGQVVITEHRNKPKGLIIFILLLLGVSSWYFFTQFDKTNLNDLLPFMHEKTIESSDDSDKKTLNVLKKHEEVIEEDAVTPEIESEKTEENNSSDEIQEEDNNTAVIALIK